MGRRCISHYIWNYFFLSLLTVEVERKGMVAEPQQAAVTNAVLLGALQEEEKENLKHVNNRNSVSLFTCSDA